MSIDSYFCMCCLSTDDLSNIFDKNQDICYADFLKELFNVFLSLDDDDEYICMECINKLQQVFNFKKQVYKSIETLREFGLITTVQENGTTLIKKVHITEKDAINLQKTKNKFTNEMETLETQEKKQKTIDEIKNNTTENIIESFLANDPVDKLERDVDIFVNSTRSDANFGPTEDLKCRICAEVLPNAYVFNTHMNTHFPNYVCEQCGRGFVTEKKLKRHKYSHNRGPFVCHDCGVKFNKYSTYDSHRKRKHSSALQYACAQCAAKFATFAQRARHLYSEHDVSPKYSCNECSATFITSGYLSTHIKYKHMKLRRHCCEVCGAGFFHKEELVGHTASHVGQSAHHCHLCNKSYLRKKALVVHLKLHKDEKKFCCDACGKRFLQKCTLTTHMKVHNRSKKEERRSPEILQEKNINNENFPEKSNANVITIEIEPLDT